MPASNATQRARRRGDGRLLPYARHQPARRVRLHEAPARADGGARRWLDRHCSPLGGLVGVPGRAAYHAAKHGIHGATKSAALEYAPHGIRIDVVAPGIIDTPMVAGMRQDEAGVIEDMMRDVPIKRLDLADEVAAAVLWLCSPAAS